MSKRHRVTTALTGIVGGALLITGCGAAAPQSAPAPGGNAGGAGVAAGGGGGEIGLSSCSAADFIVSATPVKGGEPGSFTVTFGNRSAKTCIISGGVPNLKGTDMSGAPIEELPVEDVKLPGAPAQFTLQPGQVAYYGIGMTLASGDPNAHVLTGFESSLPDRSDAEPVHITSPTPGGGEVRYPAKQLRVSSLVPSAADLAGSFH